MSMIQVIQERIISDIIESSLLVSSIFCCPSGIIIDMIYGYVS